VQCPLVRKVFAGDREPVGIIQETFAGTSMLFNDVGMLSDADGLLKALKHAECFDQLANEDALLRVH
jgi:hypothetical protein